MKLRMLFISIGLTAVLCVNQISPVFASNGTGTQPTVAQKAIASVFLTKKSYLELKQVLIIPTKQGSTVSITVTVHNEDNIDLDFNDYWVRLFHKSGVRYSTQLLTEDRNKNLITAHSSEDFTYYATVGANVLLQDLQLNISMWDFNYSDYARPLGKINMPDEASTITQTANKRSVFVDGSTFDASIDNASSVIDNGHTMLTATILFNNRGMQSITIPEYQYSIRTSDGLIYPAAASGTAGTQLLPKDSKYLQIHATIPEGVSTDKLELLLSIPETTNKTAIPVSIFSLPKANLIHNDSIVIDWNSTPVSTSIDHVAMDSTQSIAGMEASNAVSVTLSFLNKGANPFIIPGTQFVFRTIDGLTYPAAVTGLTGITLNPKDKTSFTVSANLPTIFQLDGLILDLYASADAGTDSRFKQLIASFQLAASDNVIGSIGNELSFTTASGLFNVQWNKLYRLPWNDQDQLTAEITIANRNKTSLILPNFSGYFLLDDSIKVAANAVAADSSTILTAGAQRTIHLIGAIPYDLSFHSVKLVVQDHLKPLIEFASQGNAMTVPNAVGVSVYKVDNAGKPAQLKVNNVQSFISGSSKLVYGEMELTNLAKRYAQMAKLTGYLRTNDDRYYPVSVSEINTRISPNGVALVSFSGNLPKEDKISDVQLVIGESVTGSKLTAAGETPDGMVNAAVVSLPPEDVSIKPDFKNMAVANYNISLGQIKTTLGNNPGDVITSFTYDLSSNHNYEAVPQGHKLTMEIESGAAKITQDIDLENSLGTNVLSLGTSQAFMIQSSVADLANKVGSFGIYTFRIYDSFQGYKRLIAARQQYWFQMYN